MEELDPVRHVRIVAVKHSRWFANSPLVAISVMVHVVLLAVISVVYVHHQLTRDDSAPTILTTSVSKKEDKITDLKDPEPAIDRQALPTFKHTEDDPVPEQIFIPTKDLQVNQELDLPRGDQLLDSNILEGVLSDLLDLPLGNAGNSAIGPGEGPGIRGLPPSVWSGMKPGVPRIYGPRIDRPDRGRGIPGGLNPVPTVQDGLEWLKRHQDEDGRWDAASFMKHDKEGTPCDGPGNPVNDVGVTALALLAFLGDGSTMRFGPYKGVIQKAVKWLLQQQGDDGLFGTPASHEFIYSHAIAALAICEAYGLSDFKPLRRPAQKAIDYIQNARNPYKVWRYYPRDGDNDTSVTGWMVLALKSAEAFKLTVDKDAFTAALAWFDQITDPATGVAGYTKRGEGSSRKEGKQAAFPSSKTECMTAVALLSRFFLGQDPKDTKVMVAAADAMLKKPPVWSRTEGTIDMYYWYYASFALFQMGGHHWSAWNKKMLEAVVKTQRKDGNFAGSWDPVDPWGEDGGRVYSTAIMVLCLEVYYRYGKFIAGR